MSNHLEVADLMAENARLRDALKPFAKMADQADDMERVSASVGHDALGAAGMRRLVELCRAARASLIPPSDQP
jgi:hypothetical protein